MKRGFLKKAEAKKAAAKKREQKSTVQGSDEGVHPAFNGEEIIRSQDGHQQYVKLSYGNLSEQEKALPSDYDKSKAKRPYKEFDAMKTDVDDSHLLFTTIPQPSDGDGSSEWIVNGPTKAKILKAPGYPARIPKPHRPDLYEVRSTTNMGFSVFAKHDIKRGDLIFSERPLLVSPMALTSFSAIPSHYTAAQAKQVVMFENEQLLETAVGRMTEQNRANYKSLCNSHQGDGSGPLLGIMRTNGYAAETLYDGSNKNLIYTIISNVGSRINHSCMPNVRKSFKFSSFSLQFGAIRDIKAGEQLFYSYCGLDQSASERQTELDPYGFVCKCSACVNATPESDDFRKTFKSKIAQLPNTLGHDPGISSLEWLLKFEQEMIREGLDGLTEFLTLAMMIAAVYTRHGMTKEGMEYDKIVMAFQKIPKNG